MDKISANFYKIGILAFCEPGAAKSLTSPAVFNAQNCAPSAIDLETDERQIYGLCSVSLCGEGDSTPQIAEGTKFFFCPDSEEN